MSVPLAAKIGAAGTLAAGVPASYLVLNNLHFLNEVEKAILENTSVTWEVTTSDSEAVVTASTTIDISKEGEQSSLTYTWKCKITGEGVTTSNKEKFQKYLESKISSTSTPSSTEEERKLNKEKLVWECSKDRESDSENTFVTKLKLEVTNPDDDDNNPISTNLFGPKIKAT